MTLYTRKRPEFFAWYREIFFARDRGPATAGGGGCRCAGH